MAIDNDKRIGKFLRNQMNPEENEAFLRDLEVDEALRKEAQLTALMIEGLREQCIKRDVDIITEVVEAKKAARKAKLIRIARWAGSVAAILIIFWGLHTYLSEKTNETDFVAIADRFHNETSTPSYRSALTDADKELTSLFDQVGIGDDMSSVISRLQTIYDNLDSEYAYRANGNDIRLAWHLALAYLKDGQPGKATALLRAIIQDDKGTELGEKAKELLTIIEKE